MGFLVLIGMAACVIGIPAILGLWTARLIYDRLDKDAEIATPVGIVVGISVVVAASGAAALEPAIAKAFGDWVKLFGAFAAVMFVVGLFIGWLECRKPSR